MKTSLDRTFNPQGEEHSPYTRQDQHTTWDFLKEKDKNSHIFRQKRKEGRLFKNKQKLI